VASAAAVRKTMAGQVPAICIAKLVAASLLAFSASVPAIAQIDPATRGQLQYLHRSLVIAEENLGLAMRDNDIPRAKLANDLLFNLSAARMEKNLPANSCSKALEGLAGVAVAVGFAVQPATKGDPGSMNQEELRFSEMMRPGAEVLKDWYVQYSTAYRDNMSTCEQEIGAVSTARFLPTKLTQK
jgi:hypothetical protein